VFKADIQSIYRVNNAQPGADGPLSIILMSGWEPEVQASDLFLNMRYDLGRVYIRDILTHEDYTRRIREGNL
jgi:mRNA-degrading endonuclease HigB of HigAB toxin-antitoxin module